jgi:zinc protease
VGTEGSLARIRRSDVVEFHGRRYVSSRAVVAVVGDISVEEARALVAGAFPGEGGGTPATGDDPLPEAKPRPGRTTLDHPSGRGYVIVGGEAPDLTSSDSAAAGLLRLALGWKVFEEFTDGRSTAYEAGSFYNGQQSSGVFGLYVGTDPDVLEETERVLLRYLEEARKGPLPLDLVEDARGAALGFAATSSVKSSTVAFRMATREAMGRGYGSFDEWIRRTRALGPEDLETLARELFTPSRRVTVLVTTKPR